MKYLLAPLLLAAASAFAQQDGKRVKSKSGAGVNADKVFDRLQSKYRNASVAV